MINRQADEQDNREVERGTPSARHTGSDALSSITWAVILIYAGLVFLADNLGMLKAFTLPFYMFIPERFLWLNPEAWTVILIGAGVIVLIEAVLRLLIPAFSQRVGGNLVLAAILIGAGLGNIYGWNLVWPLVLIVIGLGIFIGGFGRRR